MKTIEVEGNKYKIVKDYRDAFDEELFREKYTSFFEGYDYIVGDYAYGKLRLKGFYDDKNNKASNINKYSRVDKYIEENCAYGCKYFIAKKL